VKASEPPGTVDAHVTGIGIWFRERLRPGDVVIDIGANVGDYTAFVATLVGPSGHVYAVEPAPANISTLRAALRLPRDKRSVNNRMAGPMRAQ
jgi:predicted methyltransferase